MKRVFSIIRSALLGAARDKRGSLATFIAASVVPLVAFGGLAVDTGRGYLMKSRLSYALDAAALAGGRVMYDANLRDEMIAKFFQANFPDNYMGSTVTGPNVVIDSVNNRITLDAVATMETSLMSVLGFDSMDVAGNTEVTLTSRNVEVALVIDVTGSMSNNSKIQDLKTAAHALIDIIVRDQQQPHYSKIALVPYAGGVNVGSYATQVRGPISWGTCTVPGCSRYRFPRFRNNENGDGANDPQTFDISTCVSERTGPHAYTDVAPSTSYVGLNYPQPYGPPSKQCHDEEIVPLTSNKSLLHDAIDDLETGGSTAGQIGLAWGWYLVSPNFAYLFPTDSQPAAYTDPDLAKVVIFMTDGELNTAHYNGVVARDSGDGSGWDGYKINEDATNGSSFDQASTLCSAMKAAGVIVYTVGFDVGSIAAAQDLVEDCATDPSYVYQPDSGEELAQAFHEIAVNIALLHLSK